jgi:hypothetical protein
MGVDDLGDTFSSECFLAETALNIIEHLSVRRLGLVQHVLELEVRRTEPVAEMLSKYPTTIYGRHPRRQLSSQRSRTRSGHAHMHTWLLAQRVRRNPGRQRRMDYQADRTTARLP